MQMRLAFAVAAHLEPEILLVDEVLAVGDAAFQKKCLGKMGDVARHGRTIVFVSHQMASLRHFCQRAIWLDLGKVMMDSLTHTVASAYELSLSRPNSGASEDSRASLHGTRYLSWQIADRVEGDFHVLTDLNPVKIRVNLAVSRPLDKAMLGIALYDHEYKLIWSRPPARIALETGQYAIYYTFPTIPLRPGSYVWAVAVFDDGQLIDSLYCEPAMTIATQSHQPAHDEWTGILNLPTEIEIRREDLKAAEDDGKSQSHSSQVVGAPKVSVVMSVYNGAPFLREAVESILAQTFADFEFIIIDDGSTDKTAEILSTYAKADNRVRIFRQEENRGRAESLNWGLGLARARLIARMDADDVSLPGRLKQQSDFLESHQEVGLVGGVHEIIDKNGGALATGCMPLEDQQIRTRMLEYNCMCHSAVMMKRDVALASGGYRSQLRDADDYDLWLRIAERTELANLDQVVVRYRVHSQQASIRNMEHQNWCVLAARAAASFRRSGKPDPLSKLREITSNSTLALGVTEAEARSLLISVQKSWVALLLVGDPELAIQVNARLARSSRKDSLERRVVAALWLRGAAIHYKQGRIARALFFAGRGVSTRLVAVGRPAKKLFILASGLVKRLAGARESPETPSRNGVS
jgi:hypothetical protein